MAHNLFKRTITLLNKHAIPYWLDGGTLLGLIREGSLLPWAKNINISIPEAYLDAFLHMRNKFSPFYKFKVMYDRNGKTWLAGNITRIRIKPFWTRKRYKSSDVIITPKNVSDEYIRWIDMSAFKHSVKKYVETFDTVTWQGINCSIPSFAKQYLTERYGEWNTVVKKWNSITDDHSIILPEVRDSLPDKTRLTRPPKYKKILPLTDTTLVRAKKLLIDTISILEKNNIPYWLDDGTLLGIIRDGMLLPWDVDIDIGVPGEYGEKVFSLKRDFFPRYKMLKRLAPTAWLPGKMRVAKIRPLRSEIMKDSLHLDIFFKYTVDNESLWVDSYCKKKVPRCFYENLRKITWEERDYRIPSDVEKYLEVRYGANWKTPIKEYDASVGEPTIVC